MRQFKIGDLVTCSYSEEIEQPMVIEGYNLWYTDLNVYYVKGRHKKRGNYLTVNLGECILQKYEEI